MKPVRALVALIVPLMFLFLVAGTSRAGGNLNVFIGGKSLEDKWGPVGDHFIGGFESDFEAGPISIAVNLFESVDAASDSSYDYIGDTMELHLGVKKVFMAGGMRPFIGGGLAMISGNYWYEDISGFEREDSDSSLGYWASAGVFWAMRSFNIGIEAGYSSADITIFNTELDAGGTRLGMLFGYNW